MLCSKRVALVVLVVFLQACAAPSPRHRPSGANDALLWLDEKGQTRTFAQYALEARISIANRHLNSRALASAERARVVDAVAPMEWARKGRSGEICTASNTDGLLLVHGLTDSPFLMRDLGDALMSQPLLPNRCVVARSLLLDGHGTVPGDMLQARYKTWLSTVAWGVRSFAGQAQDVHLVGFSTGGALGLSLAIRANGGTSSPALKSLILIAPAIQPVDQMAQAPGLLRLLAASGLKPWLDVHEDRDYAKYESFALNGGSQVAQLGRDLKYADFGNFPLPVFMALSLNDQTIDSRITVKRFMELKNPTSALWLAAPGGAHNTDPIVMEAIAANGERVKVVDSVFPEEGIQDFAHISLPVKTGNLHYGREGDYVDCLAYAKFSPQSWCSCWGAGPVQRIMPKSCEGSFSERDVIYGELPVGPDDGISPLKRRLTFNPRFEEMVADMRVFLMKVAMEPAP